MLLYADDVNICREITGDVYICTPQADLNIVIKFSKEWLMSINAANCVYMYFEDTKINRYSI